MDALDTVMTVLHKLQGIHSPSLLAEDQQPFLEAKEALRLWLAEATRPPAQAGAASVECEKVARLLCSQHGGNPDAVASEPHDCWDGPLWTAFTKEADEVMAVLATPAASGEIPGGMVVDATMLGEVMQDAWGEICDDAGAHPSDMKHGQGTVLFYSPGHWTSLIALRLSERLSTSKASAIEAGPYRVRESFGHWYVEKQFSCINGLSAWFSLARFSQPDEEAIGYTDGAIPDAKSFSKQVAAALNAALSAAPSAPATEAGEEA